MQGRAVSSADSVWALVSGLPSGPRERRQVMVLQAFIDDSRQEGKVLVLAGYVSTAKQWALFSNEWQSQLNMLPQWKRFKMKEAHYAGSSSIENFERIKHHYRIIKEHVLLEVCVATPIEILEKYNQQYDVPQFRRNPYFITWQTLISLYVRFASARGIKEPVEFYFDNQSEKKHIVNAWDRSYDLAPRRFQRLIKNMPTFRSDDDFLPLQAADFAAWWKRRQFMETGTSLHPGPLVPWEQDTPPYDRLHGQANDASIKQYMQTHFGKERFSVSTSFQLRPQIG